MASTLAPQRAFDYAKHFIKDMSLEKVGPQILDDVSKIMWMAAPWRWTLGSLPTVTLIAGTQDYTITFPGDFLYILDSYVSDGTIAPRDLKVEAFLPNSITTVGQASEVSAQGTLLRVGPIPATFPTTGPTLISRYKKTAPQLTAANMATAGTQVFDDEWFWVFQEGVLWRAYLYADDNRAGGATVAKGQVEYTGQLGVFQAALQFMRETEKMPLLDEKRDGLK
jgi:hypothetical protein